MKSSSTTLLLCAVLLGSASAGVTTFLLTAPADGEGRDAASGGAPARSDADAELVRRVEDLAQENRRLRERLVALELAPAPARVPVDGFVSREELEALRTELLAAARPSPLAELVAEPEQLKEQVASALIDLRKEERVEKVRSFQQNRSARLDEDVARLTEWLELDDYQADRMRDVLLAQYEREEEVRLMWEDGVDDETLGRHKQEAGERFWADASEVLTPVQFERFRAEVRGADKRD